MNEIDNWNDIGIFYWEKRTDRQKWVHEYILYPEHYRIISNIKNDSILDYGCGDGSLIKYLQKKGFANSLFAYDDSLKMRNLAKKKLEKGIVINELQYEKYDIICLNMVLQDVKNINAFLLNLKKYLRYNGNIIISLPHPVFSLIENRHLTTNREIIYRGNRKGIYRYLSEDTEKVFWNDMNWTSLYNRTIGTYSKMFSQSGYLIAEISEPKPISKEYNEKDLYEINSELPGYIFFRIIIK
ncbi:MAG: class I SAM-dependent methyltransferase [Bacteroides sp.]|nr:class I SAM-dependent methyltransferase [Bacteroides sp.]MCM1548432.1 class I SAM-dependent methyltransferase [Clostridium sp.]